MKKNIKKFIKKYFKNNLFFAIFCILFALLLLTRFYGMEEKSPFGFDQVDNAWAAKDIIVDHKFPLVGMQAKVNTGLFIGPYYYYLISPFYLITNLDPIASIFIAGLTAVFTFLVIYFVTRSIFNEKVAILAIFINVVSSYIFELDRVQWPVNFIVPISFLILFSLYKICNNNPKYFMLLAASFGFSLHIHFTSVFYIILIALAIPFIPRNKKTLRYFLFSIFIFLIFVIPIIVGLIETSIGISPTSYLSNSFHGFHLRRFLQIIGDEFIEFNAILKFPYAIYVSIFLFLTFIFLLLKEKNLKHKFIFIYLLIVWMLVPWIVFSTYSGEITNYYFGITRPVAILTFSYLIYRLVTLNRIYITFLLALMLIYFSISNLYYFFSMGPVGLPFHRSVVLEKISKGEKVEFVHGDPQSYIYYLLKQYNNEK
ncbi:MAG: glycosyltransferase family 39 protein [Candidatus Levybacteria bacterium]|nr:glycosyltransferase family 39 protein [Candidatus Levybacteria bacterium]